MVRVGREKAGAGAKQARGRARTTSGGQAQTLEWELGREAMELRRGATTLADTSTSTPDLGGANIYPMTTVARQTG